MAIAPYSVRGRPLKHRRTRFCRSPLDLKTSSICISATPIATVREAVPTTLLVLKASHCDPLHISCILRHLRDVTSWHLA